MNNKWWWHSCNSSNDAVDGCVDRTDYGAPHRLDRTDYGVINTNKWIITSVCVLHKKSVELSPCTACICCKLDSIMSSHLIKSFMFSPYTLIHDTRVYTGCYPLAALVSIKWILCLRLLQQQQDSECCFLCWSWASPPWLFAWMLSDIYLFMMW